MVYGIIEEKSREDTMDFKELTYVLAIARHQNITRAAEALHLTQPTLSKFLKALETELHQPLFQRLGNRYQPTYAGERYLQRAREILEAKRALDQEMGDIIKNNEGYLKIGFPTMRGTYMLPVTLPIFHDRYPNVRIDVHEANSEHLVKLLLDGDIDLAFFNYLDPEPGLATTVISREEVVLVMNRDSEFTRFGRKKKDCRYPHMDLKLLKDQGFILQNATQRTRQVVDRLFRQQHMEPRIILETKNIQAEAELAARGYGFTFITETHLKYIPDRSQLALFSVGSPSTTVTFVAAYRKNGYLPFHAQEYIKVVKEFT